MNIHALYRVVSPIFRRQRMRRLLKLLNPAPRAKILDVGGLPAFWTETEIDAAITLLNLPGNDPPLSNLQPRPFAFVMGDGCALPFADRTFDIVFSNSAIEHVGTWERQQAFAAEARRVGRALWVQTPAREFFVEPHLIAPVIHWLPRSLQRRLIRNFTLRGWIERPGPKEVDAFLAEVRLLTLAEMKSLFPDCTILRERFFGLTKSYIALRTAP